MSLTVAVLTCSIAMLPIDSATNNAMAHSQQRGYRPGGDTCRQAARRGWRRATGVLLCGEMVLRHHLGIVGTGRPGLHFILQKLLDFIVFLLAI